LDIKTIRSASTRLSVEILKEVRGKTLLEIHLEKLRKYKYDCR